MEDWISQILTVIAYLFFTTSFFYKDKKMLVVFFVIGNFILLFSYFLIGAFAIIPAIFATIARYIIIYFLTKNNIKSPIFLILLEFITIFACISTWDGYLSVMLILSYIQYNYGTWQSKRSVIVLTNIIHSIVLIVYNVILHNIAPIVMEILFTICVILIYFFKTKKEEKIN